MTVLPWNHNAYYDRLLLREVPAGAGRVLDVGCGTGRLSTALAARVRQVDAVDRDPVMIERARRRTPATVRCLCANIMDTDLDAGSYDAIVSMSALHHLPLAAALSRFSTALRPGGVLAAIALPSRDLPHEIPIELAGTAWHHLIGISLAVGGNRTQFGAALRRDADHDLMPVQAPQLTTRQVRRCAGAVLPGVRIRRLVLWRYLLVWRRPAGSVPPQC